MQTIKENIKNEIIIKNSKFITHLFKIKNITEVNQILEKIKLEHIDATHHCYAYIINNLKKSSDDGEPSGTAGIPILKVLENNNLSNILAIVVRYFGGIKLGANGLIRAYTKSITTTIDKTNIIALVKGYNLNIEFEYNQIKNIDYILKDIKINNKIFNKLITYNINIPKEFLNIIKQQNINYNIIEEIDLEKQ